MDSQVALRSLSPVQEPESTSFHGNGEQAFEGFLSHRLSMLSSRVSRALSRLFAERFDLTVPEWRVMAVLGRFPGVSAIDVCDITGMDKVQVSRAVGRLIEREQLDRTQDPQDRRRARLRLSELGRALHERVIPTAETYEKRLLSQLTSEEVELFSALLSKISKGFDAVKDGEADAEDDLASEREIKNRPICA